MFSDNLTKFFSVLIYILFMNIIIAQENKNIHKVENNTLTVQLKTENKILFNSDLKSKLPLMLLGKHYNPFLESYNFIVPENIFMDSKINKYNYYEQKRIRNELNQAMKVYRKGQLKSNLGIVGQILGYTQTAATLGLAIYYINKYGFK